MRRAVGRFEEALDELILQMLKGVKRMPDPMESAIGLPALWSPASSAQTEAICSTLTTTPRSRVDSDVSVGQAQRTSLRQEGSASAQFQTMLSAIVEVRNGPANRPPITFTGFDYQCRRQ
ncbi:hypothetical protein LTR72_012250 [Exophiala xenobiotica]|nr:hypothetical protein LTR72_012250 [Exophiala xenobiotica]